MAVVKNVIKRTLSLSIARGQNADGNSVSKSYVYSNVKPDAEPEQLMAVGQALGSLFDNDITGIAVVERADLMNE
jgi:patatin-like phospholipase/acyl hydrolase